MHQRNRTREDRFPSISVPPRRARIDGFVPSTTFVRPFCFALPTLQVLSLFCSRVVFLFYFAFALDFHLPVFLCGSFDKRGLLLSPAFRRPLNGRWKQRGSTAGRHRNIPRRLTFREAFSKRGRGYNISIPDALFRLRR